MSDKIEAPSFKKLEAIDNHRRIHESGRDHGQNEPHHQTGHAAEWGEYARLGLLALVILFSLAGWWKNYMTRDWLAFSATLIGGFPIYKEALDNLRKRRMTMELSMTIA